MKFEHGHRRIVDHQRQRRRRRKPLVGSLGGKTPELLLRFCDRADEHRLTGLECLRRAQPGLELREAAVHDGEAPLIRAHHDPRLIDDGRGDGLDARGHRQTCRQRMEPRRPRREGAVARLAGAKRLFGPLALDKLGIGACSQAFRVDSRSLDAFVPLRPAERVCRARAEGVNVFVIVNRELARRTEVELEQRDQPPFAHERQGGGQRPIAIFAERRRVRACERPATQETCPQARPVRRTIPFVCHRRPSGRREAARPHRPT